jgi:hypothetical protein
MKLPNIIGAVLLQIIGLIFIWRQPVACYFWPTLSRDGPRGSFSVASSLIACLSSGPFLLGASKHWNQAPVGSRSGRFGWPKNVHLVPRWRLIHPARIDKTTPQRRISSPLALSLVEERNMFPEHRSRSSIEKRISRYKFNYNILSSATINPLSC